MMNDPRKHADLRHRDDTWGPRNDDPDTWD